MQKEGNKEPNEIADGFYGKKPLSRIKVAFAGPLVNILFALAVFTILWFSGGRDKPFAEFTRRIGWVDPHSVLYEKGVRPGDLIDRYGDASFHGFKDLLVASLMKGDSVRIEGQKVDEITGGAIPFDYTLKTYPNPLSTKAKISTVGVLYPASYLIYRGTPEKNEQVDASGIALGDRIVWADGERVFSMQQLSSLINDSTAYVTIQRDGAFTHVKVPRVRLDDLKLTGYERAEVGDWQYEATLKGKLQDLYFIPYSLSPDGVVERALGFIDPATQPKNYLNTLREGDRIVAVDGIKVESSYKMLELFQSRRVLLVVEKEPAPAKPALWTKADSQFDDFSLTALNGIVAGIGREEAGHKENLQLLQPIVPTFKKDRLYLGMALSDKEVIYNPNPLKQFASVAADTWQTLSALLSGYLNPKYMSGPVGIVQVVHQSWMVGFKEAIFWLGLISLNLGIVNLLPIPVLDGGHILLSIAEAIRRKPFKAKTMERLVIPFVGLLIFFFVYITYQDITRLFSKFF